MTAMKKYPRTPHIEGSRLQPGDEDLGQVPFAEIRGRALVVEEKIDGANSGVSFDDRGQLQLQSRGHFLTGGPRERHFHLLKTWAATHQDGLREALGARYIMYGEWMYARHTVFYDWLPHYFLEFDILDRETGAFLDTPSRRALLEGLPVVGVPVLHAGALQKKTPPSTNRPTGGPAWIGSSPTTGWTARSRCVRPTDRSWPRGSTSRSRRAGA